MGAKKKAVAAGAAAKHAKESPYVQRLLRDDDLQESIREAYESARAAYSRLNNGKSPARALLDDKKLHKELKSAADSFREASIALREAPHQRKGGFMRKLLLLSVAGGLALALSEGLRKKVLDALFGAEEEFEYTSTTASGGTTAGTTTDTPSTGSATTPTGAS